MRIDLGKLFDEYSLRARVYPGLLTTLPILTAVLLIWPNSGLQCALASGGIATDIFRLWQGLPVKLVVHAYVYPGFDNVAAKSPRAGRALRGLLYRAERTPARRFGLSHVVVLQK